MGEIVLLEQEKRRGGGWHWRRCTLHFAISVLTKDKEGDTAATRGTNIHRLASWEIIITLGKKWAGLV
jgi:hypothetical protein